MGKTDKPKEDIIIVGIGPGRLGQLTLEGYDILVHARKVYFRYHFHPVFEMLKQKGVNVINLDYVYKIEGITYEQVYPIMAEIVTKEAKSNGQVQVVFAVPGNPFVLEDTTQLIIKEAKKQGLSVRVIEGMSFLENMFVELNIDLKQGLHIVNLAKLLKDGKKEISPKTPCIISSLTLPLSSCPTGKGESVFDRILNYLVDIYPAQHKVFLIKTAEVPPYKTRILPCKLSELKKKKGFINDLTSLYIPALGKES
jgi:tetrapyrrole methylase family protein/MazG family protein